MQKPSSWKTPWARVEYSNKKISVWTQKHEQHRFVHGHKSSGLKSSKFVPHGELRQSHVKTHPVTWAIASAADIQKHVDSRPQKVQDSGGARRGWKNHGEDPQENENAHMPELQNTNVTP